MATSGDRPLVDEKLVERARQALGFKGYVTNIPTTTMTGEQVIAAYHDLYQVERSFRMTKSDLAARPIYLHSEDKIEAHLTTVMAALAIARHLQDRAGLTIRAILRTLEPLRSSRIRFGTETIEFPPDIPPAAQQLLRDLNIDFKDATGH